MSRRPKRPDNTNLIEPAIRWVDDMGLGSHLTSEERHDLRSILGHAVTSEADLIRILNLLETVDARYNRMLGSASEGYYQALKDATSRALRPKSTDRFARPIIDPVYRAGPYRTDSTIDG